MHAGEFIALTGARLNGKELVAVGMATHYVPSEVRVQTIFELQAHDLQMCFYNLLFM